MKKIFLLIFVLIGITAFKSVQYDFKKAKNAKESGNKHSQLIQSAKHISLRNLTISRDSLSKLKAILVVGPAEESTKESILRNSEIAIYLRSLGINVLEFYDSKAKWSEIIKESAEANIFLYSGHGTNLGENGCAGGLCLSGENISSGLISKELKLHKNALVVFESVCNSAGSSASDNSDIGIKLATQRVSDYAHPFLKQGAVGYFACNSTNSSLKFLKAFFKGKNIKQIYENCVSPFYEKQTTEKYIYDPNFEISIAGADWGVASTRTTYTNGVKKEEKLPSFKKYSVAYVGIPGFKASDLFK